MASHLEVYRFDDTVKQFYNNRKHHSDKRLHVSEEDNLVTTSPIYSCGVVSEILPVVDVNHFP